MLQPIPQSARYGGLWVRIRHRFGPRLPEWMLAAITTLWGLVVLHPEPVFDQPAWSGFAMLFGNEHLLGATMLMLGLTRLGGLIVNGARRNVTPWIRAISAFLGFLIFVGVTTAYALSGVLSTWLAIYPVFAIVELANIYRATHDAGESHAAP